MMLMVPVTSRLYPRVGPRRMLTIALAGITVTSARSCWSTSGRTSGGFARSCSSEVSP